jgi:hypothetical protein
MNLGLLGAAIYRAIFIDQHSSRSHPNKAVDVVVCQPSGSTLVLASSTPVLPSKTNRVAICPLAFGLFPLPLAG